MATMQTKVYFSVQNFTPPDIVLCQSRSWPFIAIYLSQMVFVKIHSRSFMKIVTRVFLVPVLNLYLNFYYQPDKTLAIMITVGTLEQPEHVQYLPNLSQISFVTIHLTELAHSLSPTPPHYCMRS